VLDARVLLFCVGVSLFSALVMGLMPALLASRVDLNYALRQGAAGVSASRSQHKTRSTTGHCGSCDRAGSSFWRRTFSIQLRARRASARGFDAPGALTFHVSLRGENYAKPEQQQRYFNSLLEQLRLVPGNRESRSAAACRSRVRLACPGPSTSRAAAAHKYGTLRNDTRRSPNYFRGLGMRLLHGTPF